jgi:hypothetical protein
MLFSIVVGVALLSGAARSAAAQTLGAGVSFLGDEGGPGFVVDYWHPVHRHESGAVGWLVDIGFNHKDLGNDLGSRDASANTLTLQGGARLAGNAGPKVMWHGQGLVGVRRFHHDFGAEICDGLGLNCSDAIDDTGAMLTVGGAMQYAVSPLVGLRGQLDFPIALGGDGGSTTRFSIMLVLAR